MPIIKSEVAPTFDIHGVHVTGFASPSRGSAETCVWRLVVPPGNPGAVHSVDREEIFVALSGGAEVTLASETMTLAAGDTLVVPPHVPFSLANPGREPFVAIVAFPVGGQAALPDGPAFTPPWAA